MAKITPSAETHGDVEFELHNEDGIAERFQNGFELFLQEKKRQAVVDVLKEDIPHLADNRKFVNNVINSLGPEIVEEKRFVFLVLNPKRQPQ